MGARTKGQVLQSSHAKPVWIGWRTNPLLCGAFSTELIILALITYMPMGNDIFEQPLTCVDLRIIPAGRDCGVARRRNQQVHHEPIQSEPCRWSDATNGYIMTDTPKDPLREVRQNPPSAKLASIAA